MQRRDLPDLDVALALKSVMERYPDLQRRYLALTLNRKPSYISRMMSLLDPRWHSLVQEGVISCATVLESFKP